MTVVDLTSNSQTPNLEHALMRLFGSLIEPIRITRKRKVADAYLRSFTDRQLRDMGLTRREVELSMGLPGK